MGYFLLCNTFCSLVATSYSPYPVHVCPQLQICTCLSRRHVVERYGSVGAAPRPLLVLGLVESVLAVPIGHQTRTVLQSRLQARARKERVKSAASQLVSEGIIKINSEYRIISFPTVG